MNGRSVICSMVSVFMIGSVCARAEDNPAKQDAEKKEPAKVEAVMTDAQKEEAKKNREAEEQQKRVEKVKKQIGERQANIEKIKKQMEENKDAEMKPFADKQIEYNQKQLENYQQLLPAVEAKNKEQIEKLEAQISEINWAWSGLGEATVKINMDRLKAKKLVGENATPEMKAAFEDYSKTCDGILQTMEKKVVLEKELKDLNNKQKESLEKLRKEASALKQKEEKEKKEKEKQEKEQKEKEKKEVKKDGN